VTLGATQSKALNTFLASAPSFSPPPRLLRQAALHKRDPASLTPMS
jgi:hypothetical protein